MRNYRAWVSIAGFTLLYLATYDLLSGAMVQTPVWLVFGLATVLIWLSVEDVLTLSFPVPALVVLTLLCLAMAWGLNTSIWPNLIAAAFYAGLFIGLDRLVERKKGHPALGLGDSILIGCAAVLLGPVDTISVIMIGSLLALLWVGLRALSWQISVHTQLPFGPFLSLGLWLTFLEPDLFSRIM